ncbi:sn-glycerol-3-phosphate ABC transporter substrate-binding protein [Salinivibrio sp. ML323]|uniref:sn-glycerol-3-phosphate ABC transporter substrate-binding protein UgpB n=1 Tax=Salinivibrio sp. ML323 TaxID=1909474 RepID=UPI000986D506|nr:sn-glycerol-3-phosphate ABC transporter substrate-binding protein UgpB [Salinivibrio sp. ML323]OOE58150.1 sn-glycerol-3-phosphate ABC transporter substrate-binding protein [Salinivibrio sp. ML323]
MKTQRLTALSSALLLASFSANATTEIEWWHAMGGNLGEKVNEIAEKFNASQDDYSVKPIYKGNYTETMTGAVSAFRANKQPHIVQVFEVGTATMMSAKGAVYPVYELMENANVPFDQSDYLSSVTGYYSDEDGNMLSMPFNSSTPVLYYNKDLFAKAGVNPPKTWEEVEQVSEKLLANGAQCGFTTGWQSWVQIENLGARHNAPIATNDNGFSSVDNKMLINQSPFVDHIAKMADWQQAGIFEYGGRRSDSAPLFYSGECAMYMNSSASYAGVRESVKDFEFGVAKLPYWDKAVKQPRNTIIGGATLWVLQGHESEEYKGVAQFFSFLSQPEIQADWHQFTGYLPITHDAYELSKKQGFYATNPGTDIAIKQMTEVEPTPASKGIRLGNFVQIRDVINEELETVWSGDQSAQEALDEAVERANGLLSKFAKANQ